MRKTFKHRCTRRPAPLRPVTEENNARGEQPFGAGSGGQGTQEVLAQAVFHKGSYSEIANVMQVSAASIGGFPDPPVLSLLAGSDDASPNGRVEVHGSQGVRVTTGPPQMPPASNKNTKGVQIVTGDTQQIQIIRGFTTATSQSIFLTPDGIVMEAGTGIGGIGILSDVMIELKVGKSTITLTPTGIALKGLSITIN